MPRSRVIAGLVASLVGCSPPPTYEAPVTPTLVIEPSASDLPTTAKRSRAETPICLVTHDDFASTRQRWGLSLRRPDEVGQPQVWGRLEPEEGGRVVVQLEGDLAEDVDVSFNGDGVELHTLARSEDVRMYAGEPIWLLGVVLVARSHPVALERAAGEHVTIGIELGEDFEPTHVADRTPCSALALEPGDFDVAVLTEIERHGLYEIVGDEPVPLFADAEGGESRLALSLGAGAMVSVGVREGGRRRVRVPRSNFVVLGWAPAARLVEPPTVHGTGTTGGWGRAGRGRRGRRVRTHRRDYRCADRVPLWVLVGDARERVGTLDPRRELFINIHESPRDGMQPIFLDRSPVALRNGARFAVTTRDLSGCEVQP